MVIHSSGSQISKQEIRAYVLQKRRTLLPEEQQRWDEALLEQSHPSFHQRDAVACPQCAR